MDAVNLNTTFLSCFGQFSSIHVIMNITKRIIKMFLLVLFPSAIGKVRGRNPKSQWSHDFITMGIEILIEVLILPSIILKSYAH